MPKKQTIRVKARKPVYRVPPRVEYALSPLGETPGPILDAMYAALPEPAPGTGRREKHT